MKTTHTAYLYGLGAILLWSTVATAFKIALTYYSPIQLVFISVITSILALIVILKIQRKLYLVKTQFIARPVFYLQTGLLNPFLYYLVLFKAYDLLAAQQALALNYTWAILLPFIAAPILKHKLKIKNIIAAIIGYLGVLIIATSGQLSQLKFENTSGVIYALASTVFWCLYWIINTKDKGEPVVSLLLSFIISTPFIFITLIITDSLPSFNFNALLAGAYVGLFEMGITFVLWLMALKTCDHTANISTLAFLTPLLSMVFISLILKESITESTLMGMGLIFLALIFQRIKLTGKKI